MHRRQSGTRFPFPKSLAADGLSLCTVISEADMSFPILQTDYRPQKQICQAEFFGTYLQLCFFAAIILRAGVDKLAPVEVAAVECADQHFGGGNIGGNGHVMHVAQAQELVLPFVILRLRNGIAVYYLSI